MYKQLITYLDKKGWKYQPEPENQRIIFGVRANHGSIDCVANIFDDKKQFIFLSICNCTTFPDKYDDLVEFLTRANYGLANGSFEFDYNNGLIRFKTSLFFEPGSNLPEQILDKYIITNLFTINHYLPGIMSIMYADQQPADVIKEIEGVPGLNFN